LISWRKSGSTGHVEWGRLGGEGREREWQGIGGGVERNESGCEWCAIDGYGDVEGRKGGRGEENMGSICDISPSEGSVDEDGYCSGVGVGVFIGKEIGTDGLGTAESQQGRGGGVGERKVAAWER